MFKRGLVNKNKSGQVTIFVILGILVVAGVVLFFFLRPEMGITDEKATENPKAYIQSCIFPELKKTVQTISQQGGSLEPSPSINYNGSEIEYLCYAENYYEPCIVQQPFLKKHIEEEIEKNIKDDVVNCFNQLEDVYKSRGYDVNLKKGTPKYELLPKRVFINLKDYELNVKKGGDSQTYRNFQLSLNNNLYEMAGIAGSIIEFEFTYGDASAESYMDIYHDLKVEKNRLYDGTTIYTLTDRNTGKEFKFASRSMPLP
jgi:hypothetical protein